MSGLIYPLNNKEYTAEDVEIFNCTRTSGVYSVLDFDYTLSGYSMTIGKGLAWIKNSDFSGKAIAFKEPEELTFEEPHESLERYDVVAIRFDADTQDARLVVIKGEPSETPRLPPRSTFAWEYELFLYSVLRKPSDYNISSDNITDLREDEAYCGIMRDSVTSGVAPLQEVIVENANLKQGDFIDFDANKYTHLVATVNTTAFKCDVVLSRTGDTIGVGRVGFTGMTSMYGGSSAYNTIFMGAQIDAKTTENIGHHIQQISFSNKPEFVGEDFSGIATISKIVGVCERPEGYVKVDSLYNAESNNAQSGTAVAKAIEDAVKVASDNAKDLITESVDPHFIGDSERAQSGVAVSEALESKQDLLITGLNIKTINNKSILGEGNLDVDYSDEISAVDKRLARLAESVDLNTLDGWVYKANVSTDGKWQNVNASVLSTYVSVVPTIPGEKLVISRSAFTKNTYFACLTDFKEPVEGESLMLSSDPVLGKVVKPGENEEYTIPSDTRFIVVSVDGVFAKATPSKFILGGYDYLLSGRANVKALIDNKAVNELEENLIQLVEYGSIYSQRDFSWKIGYIYPNGGVNSGVTKYEMTELLEIPNGATICKIDNYSGNASLSAIAFYSNNEQSAENLVNSIVKETYDGAIEIEIPSNATHYACSKNKTNTDFSCGFLIDSNLKALINENTSNIKNLTASVNENTLKIDAKADKDEVSKLNELRDYYEEEVTFTWTDGFYVPSSGAVNSSATSYDKSQALNIPDDVSELKLDGYTANAALGAICFYTSNDFRPETFLKAVTYSAEEGAKTLKVPYGAKYFGCSKAKTSTNFKLCLLREGNMGRLNRGVKRNGDICFYNKKVVIGGDSTTHGVGGTGFAQDGDVIATFKGKTYKRNPNGYCWANLFKNLLETKYGAEVAINACTGSNANDWANHITELVPTDTDVFILMIGTNDRANTANRIDYESIRTIMRSSFDSIKRYCDLNDIDFVLCSPAPVSAENEVFTNQDGSNTYAINICQIQEIIKEWTMDSGTKFRDTYTKLYDYYFVKGTDNIGTFADGLHPDDAMYYVMFHIYCSMFRVGATVPKLSIPN